MQQPRLRFKEFGDEWKENKLNQLGKISAGGDVDKNKLLINGKYPVIANGLVNDGIIGYYDDYYKISKPSVTITGRGSVGFAKARKYKYTPVVRLLVFITDLNIYFSAKAINNLNILNESTGVPQLTSIQLRNYKIKYPSLQEQNKIGQYFILLDRMIKLQQNRIEHLKKLKQGYLQKMFTNEDEPRLRFNEFNDKWRIEKLNSFLLIPQKEKAEIKGLNDIMTLKLHFKGLRKSSSRETLSLKATNYYIRHKGQLIYGKQNFFYGSIAIIPNEFDGLATSQDVPSLNISNIDKNYLFYFISRKPFLAYSKRFATGTGSKRLHERNLLNLKISVPSHFEQNQIGRFFNLLDQQIELANKKLTSLQQDKKGYLQKMFI